MFKNNQVELISDLVYVVPIPYGPSHSEEVKPFFTELKIEALPGLLMAVGNKMRFRQEIPAEVF